MPSIRGVDIQSDRVIITMTNGMEKTMLLSDVKIPPNVTIEQADAMATEYLQKMYEQSWTLDDPSWEGDLGRIGLVPPVLLPNERIEKVKGKDTYIVIEMFVAVHFFSLNPIKYTIRCQNSELGPIGGEWWL